MRTKYNKTSSYFLSNKYSTEQIEGIKKYYPIADYDNLFPLFPGKNKRQITGIARAIGVKSNNPGHRNDLTNKTFGKLTVIEIDHIDNKHVIYWKCQCSCGNPNPVIVRTHQLTGGRTKSCGCIKHTSSSSKDHTGEKHGMLTAVERLPHFNGTTKTYYRCLCDCGKEKIVSGSNFVRNHVMSCGCINKREQYDSLFHPSKSQDRIYIVYKHTAPNGKVYIGITAQEANRRWQNGNGYITQHKFWRAIQKYGWNNFCHEIIADNLTEEEACLIEKEKIKEFDSVNPSKGYNVYEGGRTGKCYVNPIMQYYKDKPVNFFESITHAAKLLKVSISTVKNYVNHKVIIPNYDFKEMGIIERYKIHTELYDIRNESHLLVREITERQLKDKTIKRNKETSRAVNQYDLDGHYIKTFSSIIEAKNAISYKGNISAALSNNTISKTAGGFLWAYDTGDHNDIHPVSPNKKSRPVLQIEIETQQIIAEYESIAEASRTLHITASHISSVCDGKRKSCGGFSWAYKKKPE